MEFPKQWTVFGPYDNGLQLPADEILAGVKAVPQSLAVGQTERRGALVTLQDRAVDFTQIFGPLAGRGDGSAQFRIHRRRVLEQIKNEQAVSLAQFRPLRLFDHVLGLAQRRTCDKGREIGMLERSRPGKQSLLLRPNPQAHASVVFHYCSRHCVPPLVQLQLVHPSAAVRQAVYALKEHRGAWGR